MDDGARPPVWIGHAVLRVSDLGRSVQWWSGIGMREIERNEHVAVLELRGGTHLVLVPGAPDTGDAPFDLMVDDLDAWWTQVISLDLPANFGVTEPKAPAVQPWGLRIAYVVDPSGVLWHFAERRPEVEHDR